LRIFADYRLDVVPVPMDDDGLRLDALDRLLETYQPKFVYTMALVNKR
jgi:DNA-binding transcriptional MocR family regulator